MTFLPTDLSSLKFWGREPFQDTARTKPCFLDNNVIGAAADASSSAYHCTQSTSAYQPKYKLNIFGGSKAGWFFDGTNDLLANATLGAQLTTNWTIAVVVKKNGSATDSMLMQWGDLATGKRRAIWVSTGTGYVNFSGFGANFASTKSVTDNVAHYIVLTRSGSTIRIRVDGVEVASASPSLVAYTSNGFALGGNYQGGEYFTGYIKSPVVCSSALTGADLTNLEAYLATVAAGTNTDPLPTLLLDRTGLELYCEPELMLNGDIEDGFSLTDYSGYGRHLTALEPVPFLYTNQINGRDVVSFADDVNPLANPATFSLRCGWIVAKYNGATFPDDDNGYKGLLGDSATIQILTGNRNTANFIDPLHSYYEFRSNDKIYPASSAPAPMDEFRIIFFRFWQNLSMNGIKLGQNMPRQGAWNIALLALYSGDFCESDIRKQTKALADAYGLTLADVYPYQADKGSPKGSVQSVNFYDPPEGARISEALDDSKCELDLRFSARRQAEVKAMRDFHGSHYAAAVECIYRDYDVIPPEDISGYIDSPFQASGAVNDWIYSFKFIEK